MILVSLGLAKKPLIRCQSVLTPSISPTTTEPPDLGNLLPETWLRSHPQYRWEIDEIRKKERKLSKQHKAAIRWFRGR